MLLPLILVLLYLAFLSFHTFYYTTSVNCLVIFMECYIINERLISDVNQVKSIMESMSNLEVSFVFIQSKISDKFNASEIGDFIYGVKAFFESPEAHPETEV